MLNLTEEALFPRVPFVHCPIRTSLGVLGKKWTLLIMRDIGFLRVNLQTMGKFGRLSYVRSVRGGRSKLPHD